MSNQMRDPLDVSIIEALREDLKEERKRVEILTVALERIRVEMLTVALERKRVEMLTVALERIRDCDWVITLPDRMDAVRQIAREALE